MRIALLMLLAVGCGDNDVVTPDAPVVVAADSTVADAPVCDPPAHGVVTCASLPPECSVMQPPDHEGGLHCIPGYEDRLSYPCFCVVEHGADSWCLR